MTPEQAALFRAVCERPGDDTPRLVYADWLEENGDPARAEFIRVQCGHSGGADDIRTWAGLAGREAELWKAHRAAWEAELPWAPGVMWQPPFVRGFCEAVFVVGLGGAFRKVQDAVFAAAPVRRLTLQGITTPQLEKALRSPYFGRLSSLRFANVPLGDRAAVAIARCPHVGRLEELDLSYSDVGDAGVRAVLDSPHLTGLRAVKVHRTRAARFGQSAVDAELAARHAGGPVG